MDRNYPLSLTDLSRLLKPHEHSPTSVISRKENLTDFTDLLRLPPSSQRHLMCVRRCWPRIPILNLLSIIDIVLRNMSTPSNLLPVLTKLTSKLTSIRPSHETVLTYTAFSWIHNATVHNLRRHALYPWPNLEVHVAAGGRRVSSGPELVPGSDPDDTVAGAEDGGNGVLAFAKLEGYRFGGVGLADARQIVGIGGL